MNASELLDLWRESLTVLALVAAPVIGVTLALGLVVSIFQAATQLSDSSLSFVPKIAALLVVLAISGSWMVGHMEDHLSRSIRRLAEIGERESR